MDKQHADFCFRQAKFWLKLMDQGDLYPDAREFALRNLDKLIEELRE